MNIKGIPEGWKIKEIGVARREDYIPAVNADAEIVSATLEDIYNNPLAIVQCILERDIKIIDMSQCKVDVEVKFGEGDVWHIKDPKCFHEIKGELYSWRVRQNHYFGWQGGECPLPEGLKVSVVYRCGDVQVGSSSEQMLRNEFLAGENSPHDNDIIGFISRGPDGTHAYQHQVGES